MGKHWSSGEEVLLRTHYRNIRMKELCSFFPSRTYYSVKSKLHDLKLSTPCERNIDLSKDFGKVLDGSLLGDGGIYIGKDARNGNGHYEQGSKHKNYILDLITIFQNAGIWFGEKCPYKIYQKRDATISYTMVSSSYDYFKEQRARWYPNGIKNIPVDLILTPLTVKYWYYGDGGLNYNNQRTVCAKFHTQSFSLPNVEFLCGCFERDVGIIPSIDYDKGNPTIRIPKLSLPALLEYIGPCDLPCYLYKWVVDNREEYNYYKNNCPCTKDLLWQVK